MKLKISTITEVNTVFSLIASTAYGLGSLSGIDTEVSELLATELVENCVIEPSKNLLNHLGL